MRFADPGWFWLLVLVPWPVIWSRWRSRLGWPTLTGFARVRPGWAGWVRHVPALLRAMLVGALVAALARPQTVIGQTRIAARGVAIVVALDQSCSMETRDFRDSTGAQRSRLEAAKETFSRFVAGRPDDLIGLVTFANYPDLTVVPTLNHAFLLEAAAGTRSARPGDDGTNIGDAVAWSLDALVREQPKKKVLVVLTDGDNEPAVPRPLDPCEAARLAAALGVTLHTIAIGQEGGIVRETHPLTGLDIPSEVAGPNLPLLAEMAALGGGRMFQASDVGSLDRVFHEIDELERSPLVGQIRTRYREWYALPILVALGLLTLERVLSAGRLRTLP